ncbi:heme exporter protein CcmD [Curvivirga aplysinae]|uniref:heme exporter protein CcmD n=1 Tax=Curvivirga aplysinae TaxID=2529852 RepID=UPI0012BC61AF|nr:heme exporter protein CcmD [Curvivirga aplysinae]MTI08507.1 heme exporter protein CcmD [Curvivirga aplysinae]
MNETSFTSFLDMGGYAAYIWPVYGLTAVMMIGLLIQSIVIWRQNEAELTLLKSMKENKKKAAKSSAASEKEEEV